MQPSQIKQQILDAYEPERVVKSLFEDLPTEEVEVGFWHGLYLRITGKPKPKRYVFPKSEGDYVMFTRPHQYQSDKKCQ